MEFQDWDTFLYSADNSMPLDSAINRFRQMTRGAREAMGYRYGLQDKSMAGEIMLNEV